jgi:hypothetical protein
MFRRVEMLGGVLVFGIVATSYVPARQTKSKVHPGVARFEALLTAILGRMRDLDLIEMLAGLRHLEAPTLPPVYLKRNRHRRGPGWL